MWRSGTASQGRTKIRWRWSRTPRRSRRSRKANSMPRSSRSPCAARVEMGRCAHTPFLWASALLCAGAAAFRPRLARRRKCTRALWCHAPDARKRVTVLMGARRRCRWRARMARSVPSPSRATMARAPARRHGLECDRASAWHGANQPAEAPPPASHWKQPATQARRSRSSPSCAPSSSLTAPSPQARPARRGMAHSPRCKPNLAHGQDHLHTRAARRR